MKGNIKNQILKSFWIILTAGIFIFTGYKGVRTISDMRHPNEQSRAIDSDIAKYRNKITADSTYIENMNSSPAFREKYAREDLNMQRPGETVFHYSKR